VKEGFVGEDVFGSRGVRGRVVVVDVELVEFVAELVIDDGWETEEEEVDVVGRDIILVLLFLLWSYGVKCTICFLSLEDDWEFLEAGRKGEM
jgi:hypothetical protein